MTEDKIQDEIKDEIQDKNHDKTQDKKAESKNYFTIINRLFQTRNTNTAKALGLAEALTFLDSSIAENVMNKGLQFDNLDGLIAGLNSIRTGERTEDDPSEFFMRTLQELKYGEETDGFSSVQRKESSNLELILIADLAPEYFTLAKENKIIAGQMAFETHGVIKSMILSENYDSSHKLDNVFAEIVKVIGLRGNDLDERFQAAYQLMLKKFFHDRDKNVLVSKQSLDDIKILAKTLDSVLALTDLDKINKLIEDSPTLNNLYESAEFLISKEKINHAAYFSDIKTTLEAIFIGKSGIKMKLDKDRKIKDLAHRIEGNRIILPESLAFLSTKQENESLYIAMVAEIACSYRYNSFSLEADEFVKEKTKGSCNYEDLVKSYSNPILFRTLHSVLDLARVRSLIKRDFAGLYESRKLLDSLISRRIRSMISDSSTEERIIYSLHFALNNEDYQEIIKGLSGSNKSESNIEERSRKRNLESMLSEVSSLNLGSLSPNDLLPFVDKLYHAIAPFISEASNKRLDKISKAYNVSGKKVTVRQELKEEFVNPEDLLVQGDVFFYPEWNFEDEEYLQHHCRVVIAELGRSFDPYFSLTEHDESLIQKLKSSLEEACPSGIKKRRRLEQGDADPDLYREQRINKRMGLPFDEKTCSQKIIIKRDIATSLLLDCSASLLRRASSSGEIYMPKSTIARKTLTYFLRASQDLPDQLAAFAYHSNSKDIIEFFTIKDFQEQFSQEAYDRIRSLTPDYGNRDGAAIRHAVYLLGRQEAGTKILIHITDAYPKDSRQNAAETKYEEAYGCKDTKQAVIEARSQGIHVHGIVIDPKNIHYANFIYGQNNFTVVKNLENLPMMMISFYAGLTNK